MPLTPDITLPPPYPQPSLVPRAPLPPLYGIYFTSNYNPPQGSATQIGSTAALVPGATGPPSLIAERFVPIMGQQPPPVALSSQVLPPTDPWLVNISFSFTPLASLEGGWIFCGYGNFGPEDIPTFSTFRAADTPSGFRGGSFGETSYWAEPVGGYPPTGPYPVHSDNPPYWADATGGIFHAAARETWNAVAGEGTGPVGSAAFAYKGAMIYGAGWQGPMGMFCWTGLPGEIAGNPPGDRPWVPTGFSTGMGAPYAGYAVNGGDEACDMRFPIIACFFAGNNSTVPAFSGGSLTSTPVDPGPVIPFTGQVSVYNNTTCYSWPLKWVWCDEQILTGGVSWGGEYTALWHTNAYYAYVDISKPQEPLTTSYMGNLPTSGLIAV